MKRKTIIGLTLAVGLLLIGTVAYAHWSDYGSQGNYGTGYGYGHVYGAGYNTNVNDPAVRTYSPCYGYRHSGGDRYENYNRHAHGKGWTGHRGYGMIGSRRCW